MRLCGEGNAVLHFNNVLFTVKKVNKTKDDCVQRKEVVD